jgi:hypothetical protein
MSLMNIGSLYSVSPIEHLPVFLSGWVEFSEIIAGYFLIIDEIVLILHSGVLSI